MKSPSAPTPPDPTSTALTQGALNTSTAVNQATLNMVDQATPQGKLSYFKLPGTGKSRQVLNHEEYSNAWDRYKAGGWQGAQPRESDFMQTVWDEAPRYGSHFAPSGEQQELYDKNVQLQNFVLDGGRDQFGRVNQALSQPLDFSGAPAAASGVPSGIANAGHIYKGIGAAPQVAMGGLDPGGQRQGVQGMGLGTNYLAPSLNRQNVNPSLVDNVQTQIGADDFGDDRLRVEKALMDRLEPYLAERRNAEEVALANQGFIDPGSEGYSTAIDKVNRAENDARLAVIGAAGQEQSRLFGMDQAAGIFANQAQGQQFGQRANIADRSNMNIDANLQNRVMAQQQFNAARGQQFGQDLASATLDNSNIDAQLRNNMAVQQAENAAQGQIFGQQQARNAAANTAQSQRFGQNQAQFGAQLAAKQAQDEQRARYIREQMLLRQTPINELSAILSSSQVAPPQFPAVIPQTGIQPSNYAGAVNQQYAGQMNAYNQSRSQNNALMGSLFGLGGTVLGGALGGPIGAGIGGSLFGTAGGLVG